MQELKLKTKIKLNFRQLCPVFWLKHWANRPFAECFGQNTRQIWVPSAITLNFFYYKPGPQLGLRRVSKSRLTANLSPSPCAQGPRHTAKYLIFAACHTFSTRRSRLRRRQLRPTPFVIFISPCAMNNTWRIFSPCARYMTHGEHPLCRASGCHRRFAVGHPR